MNLHSSKKYIIKYKTKRFSKTKTVEFYGDNMVEVTLFWETFSRFKKGTRITDIQTIFVYKKWE